MKTLFLFALLSLAPHAAQASNPSLQEVKAPLKNELRDSKHPVSRWLRIITEASSRMDGRWGGISKDFQLVPAGLHSSNGSDDLYQFMMVYIETSGFRGGSQGLPFLFLFNATKETGKLVLSGFEFQALEQKGLLNRKPGVYDTSPNEEGVSAELRTQLVLEIMQTVAMVETLPKFDGEQDFYVNGTHVGKFNKVLPKSFIAIRM